MEQLHLHTDKRSRRSFTPPSKAECTFHVFLQCTPCLGKRCHFNFPV